jgi:hypothetical protein
MFNQFHPLASAYQIGIVKNPPVFGAAFCPGLNGDSVGHPEGPWDARRPRDAMDIVNYYADLGLEDDHADEA